MVLLVESTITLIEARHSSMCIFKDEQFQCHSTPRHILHKISLPNTACSLHQCANCIIGIKSFILEDDFKLTKIERFLMQPDGQNVSNTSSFFNCDASNCDCYSKQCKGDEHFCDMFQCDKDAMCNCRLTKERGSILHISEDATIENPTIINFNICLYDKSTRTHKRKLLEHEEASFKQNNLTLIYQDPILTLPDFGRLILRTDTYEKILEVVSSKQITIPFELLAYKTTLLIIFIDKNGQSVSGKIKLNGKEYCRLSNCIFCKENFRIIKCWEPVYRNCLYCLILILITIALIMIKTIIKTVIFSVKLLVLPFRLSFKLFKFFARISLLLGAYLGQKMRLIGDGFINTLEREGRNAPLIRVSTIMLLTLCLIFGESQADCSDFNIIKSELKLCESSQKFEQKCGMFTTAEISLNNIQHQTCLWFHSQDNTPLFSLKIRLESVECHFQTKREYYTFPVEFFHISQISCSQNRYCAYGYHCTKSSASGLHFESETNEARSYPGLSTCIQSGPGVGCTIVHRSACNFRRTFLVPQLTHSYEVSRITGFDCHYNIALEHSENGTISRIHLKDKLLLPGGIQINLLGAFDQPQLFMNEALVTRVSDSTEGYLLPVSPRNAPNGQMVGAIQSNSSYTKDFIFDENMAQCDFFEDQLRCSEPAQAIKTMAQTQEARLPSSRGLHNLYLHKGKLQSSLIASSAIKVQLTFTNYKISVEKTQVCPLFKDGATKVTGCYRCGVFAQILIIAKTLCDSGLIEIELQKIKTFTRAAYLTADFQDITISFLAEDKCYDEKLCFRSHTNIQCRQLSFCLDEPSIELLNLQANYTTVTSKSTGGSIFDWIHFPRMDSMFYLLKFGTALIICAGVLITVTSTLITCCCRR